jgi:hypothetical protein
MASFATATLAVAIMSDRAPLQFVITQVLKLCAAWYRQRPGRLLRCYEQIFLHESLFVAPHRLA